MESKARFAGHAIHPMLVVFPLGLLATAVIFDVLTLITHVTKFSEAAFYMIAAGVIAGIVAEVFGLIDWVAIPNGTRAKMIGLWHGVGNVIVVTLFSLSWVLRHDNPAEPPVSALVLGFVGTGLALVTGWLGGELVERLGVGISRDANLNATSSLKRESHAASHATNHA